MDDLLTAYLNCELYCGLLACIRRSCTENGEKRNNQQNFKLMLIVSNTEMGNRCSLNAEPEIITIAFFFVQMEISLRSSLPT